MKKNVFYYNIDFIDYFKYISYYLNNLSEIFIYSIYYLFLDSNINKLNIQKQYGNIIFQNPLKYYKGKSLFNYLNLLYYHSIIILFSIKRY